MQQLDILKYRAFKLHTFFKVKEIFLVACMSQKQTTS